MQECSHSLEQVILEEVVPMFQFTLTVSFFKKIYWFILFLAALCLPLHRRASVQILLVQSAGSGTCELQQLWLEGAGALAQ